MPDSNQTITVRALNAQLWKFIGSLAGIILMLGTWYLNTVNKRLDNVADIQSVMNTKIEKFSIKADLNDIKVDKLENRLDSTNTRVGLIDKQISAVETRLINHQQRLDKHEQLLNRGNRDE